MVVVVDDFDSGFVDFGCGGGMMFDFFFSSVGLMIGDYDGGLIFYFVRGFGCVWWWWWYRWLWVWLWLWLMVEVVVVDARIFF